MSTQPRQPRAASVKPPLAIRLEKFRVFLAYTARHNWKLRTIAITVLILTLTIAWWTQYVRIPLLAQHRANIIDPVVLAQEIKSLQAEYQQLSTQESLHDLNIIDQHVLDGYVAISQLLEAAQAQAKQNQLIFNYTLEDPMPANFTYLHGISSLKISINLIPDPNMPSHKIWSNMMHQIQFMVEDNHFFSLLGSHVTGSNERVEQIKLSLRIYARLPHQAVGGEG